MSQLGSRLAPKDHGSLAMSTVGATPWNRKLVFERGIGSDGRCGPCVGGSLSFQNVTGLERSWAEA